MAQLSKTQNIISWIASLAVAVLFFQTLFFKFTGAPESVYIFETLGAEPWGRIGSGIAELIAGLLILIPATRIYGALMADGIITGAILSHLTVLGIEVQGDGGTLFGLAVVILVASSVVIALHIRELPFLNRR